MDEDNKTIDDVYSLAGENLSKILDSYFFNQPTKLVKWFYQPNKSLGTSPADYCIKGKQDELESKLFALLEGNVGV